MAVRDCQQSVRQTIESVLGQELEDFEFIVVDDSSSDLTGEIVAEYAACDERIILWRNEAPLGMPASLNECLVRAGGAYIKPILAGETLDARMLAACADVLARNQDLSLVSVGQRFVDAAGGECGAPRGHVAPTRYFPGDCTIPGLAVVRSILYPTVNLVGPPASVLFRSQCIGAGFDDQFDSLAFVEYWSRILLDGHYHYLSERLCTVPVYDEHAQTEATSLTARAREHMRLAEKWSPVLAEFSISRQEFLHAALMPIAEKLSELSRHGLFQQTLARERNRTAELVASLYQLSERDALDTLKNELVAAQELCLEALRIVGFSKYAPGETVTDEKRIYLLEQQLRDLLLSPSWTRTKPLRDLKKRVVGSLEEVPELDLLRDSELVGTAEFNRAYIKYLRRQIGRVKSSLSWRIAGPMRTLERTRSGRFLASSPSSAGDSR